MSDEEQAYAEADRLMVDWMQVWLDDQASEEYTPYFTRFSEFIEMAVDAVARGLDYGSVAEEAFERVRARHYGDSPEPRWGAVEEAREERAWSYALDTPGEVLALLAERGQVVKVP